MGYGVGGRGVNGRKKGRAVGAGDGIVGLCGGWGGR